MNEAMTTVFVEQSLALPESVIEYRSLLKMGIIGCSPSEFSLSGGLDSQVGTQLTM